MRHTLLTFALVTAAALASWAQAPARPSPEDERALLKLSEDFTAAWNRNDYRAMAALWTPGGTLVNPAGHVGRGSAEVERLFMEEQTGQMKGTRFTSSCPAATIQMIQDDVALVDCAWEIAGMRDPQGQALPGTKGTYTAVAVKSGGRWRWAAGRAMIPFTPPSSPMARPMASPSVAPSPRS
jgi:uncharacterized protein (TIGR02246 family)